MRSIYVCLLNLINIIYGPGSSSCILGTLCDLGATLIWVKLTFYCFIYLSMRDTCRRHVCLCPSADTVFGSIHMFDRIKYNNIKYIFWILEYFWVVYGEKGPPSAPGWCLMSLESRMGVENINRVLI